MSSAQTDWGDWMTGWKAGQENELDGEAARIDRQKAAFGAETLAKLKDLNVLVIGCRGVGVEAAKNLILSNVGGVAVYDKQPCEARDRGSNFYVTEEHCEARTPRAEACIAQLKSLNPYCQVEVYSGEQFSIDHFLSWYDSNGGDSDGEFDEKEFGWYAQVICDALVTLPP